MSGAWSAFQGGVGDKAGEAGRRLSKQCYGVWILPYVRWEEVPAFSSKLLTQRLEGKKRKKIKVGKEGKKTKTK